MPVLWLREPNGRWHTARPARSAPLRDTDDFMLWLRVVPPLDHGTPSIDAVAAGQSAKIQAILQLSWKSNSLTVPLGLPEPAASPRVRPLDTLRGRPGQAQAPTARPKRTTTTPAPRLRRSERPNPGLTLAGGRATSCPSKWNPRPDKMPRKRHDRQLSTERDFGFPLSRQIAALPESGAALWGLLAVILCAPARRSRTGPSRDPGTTRGHVTGGLSGPQARRGLGPCPSISQVPAALGRRCGAVCRAGLLAVADIQRAGDRGPSRLAGAAGAVHGEDLPLAGNVFEALLAMGSQVDGEPRRRSRTVCETRTWPGSAVAASCVAMSTATRAPVRWTSRIRRCERRPRSAAARTPAPPRSGQPAPHRRTTPSLPRRRTRAWYPGRSCPATFPRSNR